MVICSHLMLGQLYLCMSLIGGAIVRAGFASESDEPSSTGLAKATFAGGCFWCMEPVFDGLDGIVSMRVGYTGGHVVDPSYRQVCTGTTGHTEAIELIFDPSKITYRKLLDRFWHNIDPTVIDQQFCDEGPQYRTAIFFHDPEQHREALESRAELEKTKPFADPIVTEISPADVFYPAEDYHQQYCKTNKVSYGIYSYGCGRQQRLRALWGASAGGH